MPRPHSVSDQTYFSLVKTDDLKRRVPAPISAFGWLGVMIGGGMRPRQVPETHWTAVEGGEVDGAKLQCVCGEENLVDLCAFPMLCACERRFFYDGTSVWSLLVPPGRAAA